MMVPHYNSEHFAVNQGERMGESPDPPFEKTYENILWDSVQKNSAPEVAAVEECELPLIDLKLLWAGDMESREACKKLISRASREWGFFQVINHGISGEVIERMREEQVKLFKKPFHDKKTYKDLNNFSAGSYRWGTPSATCVKQLCWSEAFHLQLSDILDSPALDSLSSSMEKYASKVSEVAQELADILGGEIISDDEKGAGFFKEKCQPCSCYLRLNRYPLCPLTLQHQMMGIMPHTDSDFLTVLHQDSVGGLQLVKDGNWIAVKPNPEALIINIGDLFQAWSNNVYKSVEHRVVANAEKERFSIAYFLCPSFDTVIKSGAIENDRGVYRSFSFGEYKKQVQEDVQMYGNKVGLPRFLVSTH